ncbi:hypothetical protein EIP86_003164 [Pleurotus ostreatoroseus]|nr:hypothetical protein EIP86_003164 [Pleurotus ostreatoroseus]
MSAPSTPSPGAENGSTGKDTVGTTPQLDTAPATDRLSGSEAVQQPATLVDPNPMLAEQRVLPFRAAGNAAPTTTAQENDNVLLDQEHAHSTSDDDEESDDNEKDDEYGDTRTDGTRKRGLDGDGSEAAVAEGGGEEGEDEGEGEDEDASGHEEVKMLIHLGKPDKEGPRTKAQRLEAQGGKAGNQGKFKDEAFDYLSSLMDDYLTIDRKPGSKGKNAELKLFWHRVSAGLWARFSWRQFKEPRHNGKKAAVEKSVEKSIKGWFRYRAKLADTGDRNPWSEAMAVLRKPQSNPPRKKAAWQVWAKGNKALIQAGMDDPMKIGERNKRAVRVFKDLPEEEKEKFEVLAQEMYEEATENHRQAEEGLPSVDPEDQKAARERLPIVLKPLLELIGQYTGYTCVTLIGGLPDEGKYRIGTVHYGETSGVIPKNLSTFDPEAFRKDFVGYFTRFLRASRPEEGSTNQSANPQVELNHDSSTRRAPANSAIPTPDTTTAHERPTVPVRTRSNDTIHPVAGPTRATNTAPPTTPNSPAIVPNAASIDTSTGGGAEMQEEAVDDETALPKGVNIAIVRAVEALSGDDRVAAIQRLRKMDDFELERECIVAQNAALIRSLGLDKRLVSPPPKPRTRTHIRPAPDSAPRRQTRARTKRGNDLSTYSSPPPEAAPEPAPSPPPSPTHGTSAGQSEHMAEGPGDTAVHGGAIASPAHSPPTHDTDAEQQDVSLITAVDLTDCPEWWRAQYGTLVMEPNIPQDLQQGWMSMLADWIALERAMQFQSPRAGLSATSRPSDVSLWIQNACRGRIVLKQSSKYATQWWKWWDTLCPAWRPREGGRPIIGGSGDWGSLLKSGSNGWVNILMGLVGLREVEDDAGWRFAFSDVQWVLHQVLLTQSGRKRPTPATDDNEEGSGMPDGARKRARR